MLRRSAAFLARWTHTFVSLVGFGALVFFSVTGLTLNHAEFFESGEPVERALSGEVDVDWVAPERGDDVARLEVVEALRRQYGARGHVAEFSVDDAELFVLFETAGYSADVVVDRSTGSFDGVEAREGFWIVVNDLHKGRSTGAWWSVLIDVSAIVLTVSGLTGLWLLWYVRKRRVSGFAATAVGIAVLAVVYALFEAA
ncbi:MAG: PepSY-associated TM helix domain-containing protein [Planctomycetota bacterium]